MPDRTRRPGDSPDTAFTVTDAEAGATLAAFLRLRAPATSWRAAKAWIRTGKVRVDGELPTGPGLALRPGQTVEVRPSAPRPDRLPPPIRIVFEDAHLVVVDKPAGLATLPGKGGETGTLLDLVLRARRRAARGRDPGPLHAAHRLDRETSGLLVLAASRLARTALGALFRRHEAERVYLAVVHGEVRSGRIESRLVADRGDGLRGSTRQPGEGRPAATSVRVLRGLRGAALLEVRPETGRTHQIRIHLAESGHPIVGDRVHGRDLVRAGGTPIESPRLLLHASVLAFPHPATGAPLRFESPPPPDFAVVLARLERGARPLSSPPAPDGRRHASGSGHRPVRSGRPRGGFDSGGSRT